MPSATISQAMPRPAEEVFELLHDFSRRLDWDTLLRVAGLTRGHVESRKGTTSLCVGKPLFGLIGIETEYIYGTTGGFFPKIPALDFRVKGVWAARRKMARIIRSCLL